jgi:hypothetical protein
MSEKRKQQQKQKPSHEGKSKNPSTGQVSLDNADTVIEGGPFPWKASVPRQGVHVDDQEVVPASERLMGGL